MDAPLPGDGDRLGDFLRSRIPGLAGTGGGHIAVIEADGLFKLWKSGAATAGTLADLMAEFHGLKRADFSEISTYAAEFRDLSRRYLRESHVYPYQDGRDLRLAVANPANTDVLRSVGLALGVKPQLCVVSYEDIELLFERSAETPDLTTSVNVAEPDGAPAGQETLDSLQDLARGAPVVRMIDHILERAVDVGATDIHFETERDRLRVRLRVDGYLRPDQMLPLAMAPAIISRLKILAGLDIADRRLPQDGRANLRVGKVEADLRVAVMPTVHGETAVLRILTRDTRLLDFARIGMADTDRGVLESLLAEPNGIIIVTGPTGSGKTTTLATAISRLNDPARKIVTIEDPVEYQIAGVHQTQIKPSIGLTFASALRSFLRHDPDVIMVGEMRDHETASVGIQAALTGHLVLTTLHTNSACDAVIRLADMGVEPYLIAASLRGAVGQRLVRKLCDRCKAPDDRVRLITEKIADARGAARPSGDSHCIARGCDACGQTGYRGRIGIFEIVHATEEVQAMIRTRADPRAIVDAVRRAGTTLMLEDGLQKCSEGLTSMDEVVRATG